MYRWRAVPFVSLWVVIASIATIAPQGYDYVPSPFKGLAKVAFGTTHVHTIASNDYTFHEAAKTYLQKTLEVLKVDPDHIIAEDIEPTARRAYQMGNGFLLWQDHAGKFSPGFWRRMKDFGETYENVQCFRGFEWTQGGLVELNPPAKARHGVINHIGVFGTQGYTDLTLRKESLDAGMKETKSVNELYSWLLLNQRSQHVFCCFNHPGYGDDQFNHFGLPGYLEPVKRYFRIIEVGSGSGVFYEDIASLEKYYIEAIQKGWRLMPGIGADNYGKLTYRDARARHLAIWRFMDQSLEEAINECQGFASEDPNAIVKFWVENIHCPPADGGYNEAGAMGHIGTFSKLAPPTARWHVTNSSSPVTQLMLVFVYPKHTQVVKLENGQSSYPIPNDPRLMACYLKGVTKANTLFVTAPVYFVHRNHFLQRVRQTQPFGAVTIKFSGLKIDTRDDNIPLLQHWVAPALELAWSHYTPGWELVCQWIAPDSFMQTPYEETINDPDVLAKGKTIQFIPALRILERPVQPGNYSITVVMRRNGHVNSDQPIISFRFEVDDPPMPYVPRVLLPQ
ncbi:hypothetical protein HY065_02095 [Candidatus Berkelbacteria bacterium]|nr:hypothetical protein [Candidatus Berkelbacteria bacterium]